MSGWQQPPEEVPPEEFVTQDSAAETLGVTGLAVGKLIGDGRLAPATLRGAPGVTRSSLASELERRSKPMWRLKSFLGSVLRSLSP